MSLPPQLAGSPGAPSAVAPRPRPALGRTIIALGLTSLFTDVGSEMIFPLLPAFLLSLGAGPTFLGLVEGAADATSSLLKLASGAWADRMKRKKPIVLFGYALAALVRPLVALATAPWHVLAVRLSDRVGKGVRSAPRDLLIANAAEPTAVGRAFGFHTAMDHAGAVLGPLVATVLLASGVPLRWVFAAAAIPGALSVACVLLARETPAPSTASPAVAELPSSLVGNRPLRRYLLILLVFSIGNSSDALLLLRAHELGLEATLLPILWTVFHLSKVGSAYLGGASADRLPKATLIIAGWAVYALTYAGFAWASAAWQVWALFIVYGTYYGLTEPAEKALVKELAPAAARGRAYGWYNFVLGASALPAGLMSGWLWEHAGAGTALAVGAGLAATASALLLLSPKRP